MSVDILTRIVESVRGRLASTPPAPGLEERAREFARERKVRSLSAALGTPGIRVIAECKRRSPSAGTLRDPFDAVELAGAYEEGGAAAVSVVTEPAFFAGDPAWIPAVRARVSLPVLRKDFVISARQIFESVLIGADAVLLIVRLLDGDALRELRSLAEELGIETLVEAHDEAERARAIDAGAVIIGVNARDLETFSVDSARAVRLIGGLGAERIGVLESGVRGGEDVRAASEAGVRRFLVGEHLLRSPNPARAVAELVACG